MIQFLVKTVVSALLIAGSSELARRSTFAGAILVSLPLTSLIALLWMWQSGLRAATKSSTDSLRSALARTAALGTGHVTKMHVSRRPPRTPLMVEVFPVGQLAVSMPGSRTPRAVIFLRESDTLPKISRPAIMDFYGLTPREAEASACLVDGLTVELIAEKLNLAKGTVRNNLKRVFEKTNTHSQVELLAVLRGFGSH